MACSLERRLAAPRAQLPNSQRPSSGYRATRFSKAGSSSAGSPWGKVGGLEGAAGLLPLSRDRPAP
ncbi:MAG: hypothetical protein ACK5Q6_14910, partial [Cyanobacteriota bacterium]